MLQNKKQLTRGHSLRIFMTPVPRAGAGKKKTNFVLCSRTREKERKARERIHSWIARIFFVCEGGRIFLVLCVRAEIRRCCMTEDRN